MSDFELDINISYLILTLINSQVFFANDGLLRCNMEVDPGTMHNQQITTARIIVAAEDYVSAVH